MKARVAAVLAVDDAVEQAGRIAGRLGGDRVAALDQRAAPAALGQRPRGRAAGQSAADDQCVRVRWVAPASREAGATWHEARGEMRLSMGRRRLPTRVASRCRSRPPRNACSAAGRDGAPSMSPRVRRAARVPSRGAARPTAARSRRRSSRSGRRRRSRRCRAASALRHRGPISSWTRPSSNARRCRSGVGGGRASESSACSAASCGRCGHCTSVRDAMPRPR